MIKTLFKFLKYTFYTLILFIIGFLTFDFAIKKNPGSNYNELDNTDKALFDDLKRQYSHFSKDPNTFWDENFKYDKTPLILIRTNKDKGSIWNYAYLVNCSQYMDTSKFKKVNFDSPLLNDVYTAKSLGLKNCLLFWFPANFYVRKFNEKDDILAFKYYPDMFTKLKNSDMGFKYFCMHESFHVNAQSEWLYDANSATLINNYPYIEEHYQLLRKEYKIYDKLKETRDIKVISKLLKEWLEIRDIRYKKWPQLKNETNSEAIEGSAKYVELKYADIINDDKNQIKSFKSFEKVLNIVLNDKNLHFHLDRYFSYEKGAILGYALDVIDPNWKTKIKDSKHKRGKTQYEIIKDYFEKKQV